MPTPRPTPRRKTRKKLPQLTARNSDKFELYINAVQSPDHEIDFVTKEFAKIRSRPLRLVREDFCGTAISACEFVKRHRENHAVALDLDKPTLAWGMKHNVAKLDDAAQKRIKLLPRNVLTPGTDAMGVDAVLAMNFSYWIFETREAMLRYFRVVHKSLTKDGVFFMDVHGGYESTKEMTERTRRSAGGGRWFKYVWEQKSFDPLSNHAECRIHFEFENGPAMKDAFTYHWRVWSIPELRELLTEAGFKSVSVYLEGDDGKGGGNGVFRPKSKGDADASFIAYMVAVK